jgi:hypothetical protein
MSLGNTVLLRVAQLHMYPSIWAKKVPMTVPIKH